VRKLTTLLHSCAVVMKSGNLNFLEPSGPLQACKGLLYLTLKADVIGSFERRNLCTQHVRSSATKKNLNKKLSSLKICDKVLILTVTITGILPFLIFIKHDVSAVDSVSITRLKSKYKTHSVDTIIKLKHSLSTELELRTTEFKTMYKEQIIIFVSLQHS
jgi:hypothetical protein